MANHQAANEPTSHALADCYSASASEDHTGTPEGDIRAARASSRCSRAVA